VPGCKLLMRLYGNAVPVPELIQSALQRQTTGWSGGSMAPDGHFYGAVRGSWQQFSQLRLHSSILNRRERVMRGPLAKPLPAVQVLSSKNMLRFTKCPTRQRQH
jgi:hypothetical protein